MSGGKILEQIKIELRDIHTQEQLPVYVDIYDNSLSHKWLSALNHLLANNYHLEKNFCFVGFADAERNGDYILTQVNRSIAAINSADLGYQINDEFTLDNTLNYRHIVHDKFNQLHRYFEDLQGVSGHMSPFYNRATADTRWHIRQLNLLCHEFENWALSYHKQQHGPEWCRPSQLMCWLTAPRFVLEPEDYELFGVETINRALGGVFVGVNKAVGKHHWEVFNDEGRDSRISELVTSTMRSQTEAAGDFDIEWGQNPGEHAWQKQKLQDFRAWLRDNGFDPEDKNLTIGHPQVGQVDLQRSFGTKDYRSVWAQLNTRLDVYSITTSDASCLYDYHWSDNNFQQRQVDIISKGC